MAPAARTHSRRIQKSHYSDGALLLSSVRNNGKTARAFAATQISIFSRKIPGACFLKIFYIHQNLIRNFSKKNYF
jgi:hypothetical protein